MHGSALLTHSRCAAPHAAAWQDKSLINLADWYEAFAAVHSASTQAGGKGKKAAVKKGGKGKAAAAAGEGAGDEAERKRRRELAARFSQATAELQYIGVIKPAKRRKGDFVQRVVHMPATGL